MEGSTANALRLSLVILLSLASTTGLILALPQAQATSLERSESIVLSTGDWFSISSNRESLQLVEIRGNMSAARFSSAGAYPTTAFNLTSDAPAHYSVQLSFGYPTEYTVTITLKPTDGATQEEPSYYVSSGELLLTVDMDFKTRDTIAPASSSSIWDSFSSWTTRFGDAFPLWVKLLYVLLGVQFLAVGYKWTKFENMRRGEDSLLSKFDRGNLVYLSSEILFKFLLTAFLIIAVAMGGQLILLSVLNFMFLAPVKMLSLWDLFVIGFAAGITMIAYTIKLCLEKSLDFRPLFQE
jgi:hypothetical protein